MQKKVKIPMQRTMKLEIWNKCSGGGGGHHREYYLHRRFGEGDSLAHRS